MDHPENDFDRDAQRQIVENAMRHAGKKAVLLHRITGAPLVVWRDGKVVFLDPNEVAIDNSPPSKIDFDISELCDSLDVSSKN